MSDPGTQSTKKRFAARRAFGAAFPWAFLALNVLIFTPIDLVPAAATSAERTLHFKLPIEGTEFHWEFLDREAFLSGELTLRIINEGRDQTLVVFRDGKIQDGWRMTGDQRRGSDRFYFGFFNKGRFRSRADDSLIVTLRTTKDLPGQGPDFEGVLPAGTWQMSGTYSAIYGGRWNPIDLMAREGRAPVAYMMCWAGTWPIRITKQEGWMGPESNDDRNTGRRRITKRGTNGRECKSHV